MFALLPFVSFLLLWRLVEGMLLRTLKTKGEPYLRTWRDAFLITTVILGAFVAVSSELLGAIHRIDETGIRVVWCGAFVCLAGIAWACGLWTREKLLSGLERSRKWFLSLLNWSLAERCLLAGILLYLTVTLIVALVAPPNTNDSLQYHMSRVMHWAQNHTLEHYVTPISRQLWMPPWAELAILHSVLLLQSDYLANFVQWFSMLASLLTVYLIAERLGAPRLGKLFAVVFAITIRMGIMQATSTQTDYAASLWVILLVYFILVLAQNGLDILGKQNWLALPVLLSLIVSVGILTKGTFVAFALPFLFWLLWIMLTWNGWRKTGIFLAIGLVTIFLLNGWLWARNIQAYGSPLGPKTSPMNEIFGAPVVISNMVRNATLHIGTPYGIINGPLRMGVEWIHTHILGLDASDPRTSLDPYWIKRGLNEDYGSNNLHFWFIVLSLCVCLAINLVNRGSKKISLERWAISPHLLFYMVSVLCAYLIFCFLFKWQRTGSRLMLPLFILWAPVAGSFVSRLSLRWQYLFAVIFLLGGLPSLFSNPSRPFLSRESTPSILQASRAALLFVNAPDIKDPYLALIADVKKSGCQEIGLQIDSHDAEYVFWALLALPNFTVRIEHLPYEDWMRVPGFESEFEPCALICTVCKGDSSIDGYAPIHEYSDGCKLFISESSR